MSTRPNSNTANSPAGPPPTISASVSIGAGPTVPSAAIECSLRSLMGLELLLGDADYKAVQLWRDTDLTGQPAGGAHVVGEVEHVLLHLAGSARLLLPGVVDIDMTRRTGAGASALGLYALDEVHLGR